MAIARDSGSAFPITANAIVAFRSAGAPASANQQTNSWIDLNAPAGVTSTDVVIAIITQYGGSTFTVTAPSGWTLIKNTDDNTAPHQQKLVAYWALGNVASYRFTTNTTFTSIVGVTRAYSGVDNTTPLDATAVAQLNASSTTYTAPTITTVSSNAMLVSAWCDHLDTSSVVTVFSSEQPGSNVSGLSFADTLNGNIQSVDSSDGIQATSGASGTKTVTVTRALASIGMLIALRPGRTCTSPAFSTNAGALIVVTLGWVNNAAAAAPYTCAWEGSAPAGASAFTQVVSAALTGSVAPNVGGSSIWVATASQAIASGRVVVTATTADTSCSMALAVDALTGASSTVTNTGFVASADSAAVNRFITLAGVSSGSWLYVAYSDGNAFGALTTQSGTTTAKSSAALLNADVGYNSSGTGGSIAVGWTGTATFASTCAAEITVSNTSRFLASLGVGN